MIVRFFQRWAMFFAILTGIVARDLIFSEDADWWLELPVSVAITVGAYALLYKDGVTTNRPSKIDRTLSR